MTLRSKILSGHIISIFFVCIIIAFTLTRISSLVSTIQWVSHTHEVISKAHNIEKLLVDIETGQRGFLITGKENFLEPYTKGTIEHNEVMSELLELISDNPSQALKAKHIDSLVEKWHEQAAIPEIEERRKMNRGEASMQDVSSLIIAETGKDIIDETRYKLKEFIEIEHVLLAEREIIARNKTYTVVKVVLAGSTIIIFISFSALYFTSKSICNQIGGEPEQIASITGKIADGNFDIHISEKNPTGMLKSVVSMASSLREQREKIDHNQDILEDTVEERTKELEASRQELESFAYAISHDLKAPLRAVDNLSQWIAEDLGNDLPEGVDNKIMVLRERVQRMKKLIDGLLELSRVGRNDSNIESFCTERTVREIISSLYDDNGAIEFDIKSLPKIESNQIRFSQVMSNIIDNGVKHNESDKPRIEIGYQDLGNLIEFYIKDNGIGIEDKYHSKIFDIFTKLSPKDDGDGVGAGLALIQRIVAQMGGTIRLESEAGTGTVFYFTWPKEPIRDNSNENI